MCGVSRKHRGAEARSALGRGCAGGARPGPGAEGPMWGLSGTSGGAGGLHRACRSGPSSRGSRRRPVLWGPGGGRAHPVWPAPGRAGREAPARRCPADPRPGPGPACAEPRRALLGTRLCPRVRPGPCGQGGLLLPIAPRPVSQADGGWDADVAGAAVGSGRSAQLALHRPRPWAPGEAKGRRPPRMSLSYSPCHAQSLRMHVTSRSSARCAGRRSRPPVAGWRAGVPARPLHAQ